MDFKRIEVIFLCAFLSLNIFLIFTYRQGHLEANMVTGLETVATIESRLQGDKITFAKDFSRDSQQGYYLSGESTDFSKLNLSEGDVIEHQQLLRTFPPAKEYKLTKDHAQQELLTFIKKNDSIYQHQDYTHLEWTNEADKKAVASQEFEDLPFNDETSELLMEITDATAGELVIRGFTQRHVAEVEALREAQDIIPESDAIETLYMSNKIPTEGKIVKTQLAYTRLFTVREKNVYIPAWFVWIENNKKNIQVERVNGFSNSIISASVPEVKK